VRRTPANAPRRAARRAAKRRAAGGPPCTRDGVRLPGAYLVQWNRADVLWAQAADRSANACEALASVHERLAKAGSGDIAEHCRRVCDYRAAAGLFREAAAAFRTAG